MYDDLESSLHRAVVNATGIRVEEAGIGPYEYWGRVGYDTGWSVELDVPDVVRDVEWVGGPPEVDELDVHVRRESGTLSASTTVVCRVVPGTLRQSSGGRWTADFEVL